MKKYLYANWKMNKTRQEALNFLAGMDRVLDGNIAIVAPFTLLSDMAEHARSLGVKLGGQNMSAHSHGAYTGEISATQLRDVGAEFVILGHSERRTYFGETDEMVAKKVERAVVENMHFMLCVGETSDEREQGMTEEVLTRQISTALESLTGDYSRLLMIAYEPVWAIGTREAATPEIAEETHEYIRERLAELFSEQTAEMVPILYGGSVNESNLEELLDCPNINGALVGGASLEISKFNQMVQLC